LSATEPVGRGGEPPAGLAGEVRLGGQVSVNRLGFGAMRIPGARGEPAGAPKGHRLLRRAVELGINLIDTAHAYRESRLKGQEGCREVGALFYVRF
jgi:diketogulonate reductase-like aldo/keto reductase